MATPSHQRTQGHGNGYWPTPLVAWWLVFPYNASSAFKMPSAPGLTLLGET